MQLLMQNSTDPTPRSVLARLATMSDFPDKRDASLPVLIGHIPSRTFLMYPDSRVFEVLLLPSPPSADFAVALAQVKEHDLASPAPDWKLANDAVGDLETALVTVPMPYTP
jgi:hypothetical protein